MLNRLYRHLRWSEAFFNIKHGNCFIFHFTNLFRAELDKFDYSIWKKANLKQIGNFLETPLWSFQSSLDVLTGAFIVRKHE